MEWNEQSPRQWRGNSEIGKVRVELNFEQLERGMAKALGASPDRRHHVMVSTLGVKVPRIKTCLKLINKPCKLIFVVSSFFKENRFLATYTLAVIITIIALWLINYFNISYPLTITSRTASGELAVVGVGRVDATPNTATVDLGIVVNDAKTIEEASTQINKVNNAIVQNLQGIGIDKADIKTSNYSIVPNYDYTRGAGAIIGYNGNTTVTVKVKDTSKLPQVIEAGTKGGANQVMGTNYMIEKPETYQEQAREKAIQNAKEQAQKLADELGIRLGKVVNIVEATGGSGPVPMYYDKVALSVEGRGGTNAPVPDLQPGSQTITSTVTLYFEKR